MKNVMRRVNSKAEAIAILTSKTLPRSFVMPLHLSAYQVYKKCCIEGTSLMQQGKSCMSLFSDYPPPIGSIHSPHRVPLLGAIKDTVDNHKASMTDYDAMLSTQKTSNQTSSSPYPKQPLTDESIALRESVSWLSSSSGTMTSSHDKSKGSDDGNDADAAALLMGLKSNTASANTRRKKKRRRSITKIISARKKRCKNPSVSTTKSKPVPHIDVAKRVNLAKPNRVNDEDDIDFGLRFE